MQIAPLANFLGSAPVLPLAEVGLLFVFLLAAGVTAMASVGFVLWATYHLIRLIVLLLVRLLMLPGGSGRSRQGPAVPSHLACPDPVCRTVNPDHARFCRQCGRPLRHLRIAA